MCSVIYDMFDEHDIEFILQLDTVQFAKQQPSHTFQIELPIHMQQQLKEKLGIQVSTIPMKWIKGNTYPHIDQCNQTFQQTHLIYLTDSEGYFIIDNQPYPIKKNSAFSFSEGISHETVETGSIPRLLMGPMSETGIPVGGGPSLNYSGGTTIYIRDIDSSIEYTIDQITWNPLYFPCYITNNDSSLGLLKVIFTTDITISNVYQYFECLSSHIQFGSTSLNSNGSCTTITIDSVSDYLGLIKNGSGVTAGYSYIYVFNLKVISNESTLYSSSNIAGGWIGHQYFGTESSYNYIVNCSSTGDISSYGGGIVGSYAAYGSPNYINIIGCSTSGTINSYGGGIAGYFSHYIKINSSWSTGEILANAGGIVGDSCKNIIIVNCYTNGNISGEGAGGIIGSNCGSINNMISIQSSYTTGSITGNYSGGLSGSYSNYVYINNCYTLGNVSGTSSGAICGVHDQTNNIEIYNSYTIGLVDNNGYFNGVDSNNYSVYSNNIYSEAQTGTPGTWNKTNALTVLTGTPISPSIIGDIWIETITNSAFELYNMGYSPYTIESIRFIGPVASLNNSYPIIGDIPLKDMLDDNYDYEINPYSKQSVLFPDLADFTTDNIVQGDKSEENKYVASYWDDLGNDIFDDWGYFYIYDVTTSKYYFPLLSPQNQSDNITTTQIFTAFNRTFTIKHGWTIRGIFKIDISVNDSLPFRFGAYGNMGSDTYENQGNLTDTYTLNSESKTLYYRYDIQTDSNIEILFTYVIPYNDSDNTSQPYSVYYDGDDMSFYTNSITSGVTIYFSKGKDTKSYVIDQVKLANGDSISNIYTLNASESTNSAIIPGKSYEILQKMFYNSETISYELIEDNTITINTTTGIISTTSSTPVGYYKIYIRNNGSYHISEYNLILPDIIYADGSSDIIYIKYDSTIQYKINNGSYYTPSFPIKICNNSSTSLLKVLFENDITITNKSCYFVCESSNIQFGSTLLNSDGSRPTITIDNVSDYPGLIKNGTSNINGYNYIYVFNLKVVSNSSNLEEYAGWICQSYFGKNTSHNYIANCRSTGDMSINTGGIIGGYGGYLGNVKLIHCSSTGSIGLNSGGIAGPYSAFSGLIICEECWSEGEITEYGGGICGKNTGYNGSVIISKCFTTGNIGLRGGGIFASYTASDSGNVTANHCYSTGSISEYAGGIVASLTDNSGTINIDNCFTVGIIAENGGGIKGIDSTTNVTITNCYVANGVWDKSNAISILSGTPSDSILGTIFSETHTNEHYRLHSHGHTPYSSNNLTIHNNVPSLNKTYTQTITNGDSSISGIVSGEYRILSSTITSSTVPNYSFAMNEITGLITTTYNPSLTSKATIEMVIYNTGSYHISTFTLTVDPISSVPICFPAGTPILTDQGEIPIHKLDINKHTIKTQPIIAITQTIPLYDYIICIRKNSLGLHLPTRHTFISKDHKVLYMNKLVPSETLPGAIKVKYSNQILYNVLLKDYSTMSVNQLTVETLHPDNTLAKIYSNGYTPEQKRKLIEYSNKFNLQQRKKQIIHSNFLNILYK